MLDTTDDTAEAATTTRDAERPARAVALADPHANAGTQLDARAGGAVAVAGGGVPLPVDRSVRPRRFPWRAVSFVLLVLLPFAGAAYYYGWVASSQYVAEARFVVREIQEPDSVDGEGGAQESGVAAALSMTALGQDAYVVTSFIDSLNIIDRLMEHIDLRALFSDPSIDPLSRLPADASREDLLDYWTGRVSTDVDGPSGIVTMQVRAFAPEEARRIAEAILNESEELVNELSERARLDVIERADLEVERARESYEASLAALNAYQNEVGILAPQQEGAAVATLLTGLLAEQLQIDAKLSVLRASDATLSPNFTMLTRASEEISSQIAELRAGVAGEAGGTGDGSAREQLSGAVVEFSRLETERVVTEKLYTIAHRNLDLARAKAARQAVYLATFAEPFVPEKALYPRRVEAPLLILLGLLVVWGTGLLLWASVEDHKQ